MTVRNWGAPTGIALALAGGMLLSGGAPAPAFEIVVEEAQTSEVQDAPMTRRDFLQALYPMVKRLEAQGAIAPAQHPSISTFADLEGADRDWATELSGRFHLFVGVPALSAGRFNASLPVSRWEAALVLGELLRRTHPQALQLLPSQELPPFLDLTPAERSRLQEVMTLGVFVGYPDQTFRSQEPLTQEQWRRISERLSPLMAFQAPPPEPRKPSSFLDEYRLLNQVHGR